MKFKDYYQALGVGRNATPDEIKQAYRKLAHKYHPDISKDPHGEEKFKEIAEAYATLKDPDKKQEYDSLGRKLEGESFTPPPHWQQHFGKDRSIFDDVDLSDIFSAFTSPRHGAPRHAKKQAIDGQDYETPVSVSLEQIFRGDEINVDTNIPEIDEYGLPHHVPRSFRVKIPKTAGEGQRLRLTGKGGAGRNGGKSGDLYIELHVIPHHFYRVNGRDLTIDLPLAPWEAVLGGEVQIPTLGGFVQLTVQSGTTAGKKLRLPKRGLPSAKGEMGDLYAVVKIVVPGQVSAREQQLLAQLAAASNFNPREHFKAEAWQ